MELTDEIVKATLAKFMGHDDPNSDRGIHRGRCLCDEKELGLGYCGSISFEGHLLQMKDPSSWVHGSVNRWKRAAMESIPDYLSEPAGYGPIAEVYRKFIDKHGTNHDLPVGDWWEHRPRDHAYALARAILESK